MPDTRPEAGPAAERTTPEAIGPWRARYREEMRCQIVHDSLHERPGWTRPYWLRVDGVTAGYGSVLVGGPWAGTRTAFELYVAPERRGRAFALFEALLAAGDATHVLAQTNDPLLTAMLHTYAADVSSESIVFADGGTTALPAPAGATLRRAPGQRGEAWELVIDGTVAASGGILFHYNPPHGDIYMEVAEPFRRRGLGAWLVQELKRVCREGGSVPCARCNTDNVASRATLQRAGLVPVAHILSGPVARLRPSAGTAPRE
jgi:GNAT superfamily N-acetyltransferase